MRFRAHGPNRSDSDVWRQEGIQLCGEPGGIEMPADVRVKVLLHAMNARIGPSTAHNRGRLPEQRRKRFLQYRLDAQRIVLALPTGVLPAEIGDLEEIPHNQGG